MLKKKWRDIVIIAVCVVAVVVTAVLYSVFTSTHIFNESSNHLMEIYEQVNATFSQTVDHDRKLLRGWEQYIDNSANEINNGIGDVTEEARKAAEDRQNELNAFISEQKELCNITNFYFISDTTEENGRLVQCKRLNGETSKLRFRRSFDELMDEDKGGVVGYVEDDPDEKLFMMFAVNVTPNTYRCFGGDDESFSYSAIGISFNAEDMQKSLDIAAFGDRGMCYVVLPSGDVLLQSRADGITRTNYLDFLKSSEVTVKGKSIEEIVRDWNPNLVDANGRAQASDTVLIRVGKREYYFTYLPIPFGDWMLLGIVPSDVVNGSMSWFRNVTVVIMAAIFVVVGAAIAWILILNNKRRVKEKEVEIKSRENLLDLLTMNTNDLFILFSPDTFAAEYVSANIERVLGLRAEDIRKDAHRVLDAAVENHGAFTTEGLKKLPAGGTWGNDILMRHMTEDVRYWFKLTLYHSVYNGKDSCVMMFSDRTKERKMNDDLQDALGIAKSANEAKSNFLSNMSHDIRTPMNAIIGYTTLLAKDADKADKVREYVRKIAFSGQHLLSLINDILDMSKIESGKTSLNVEEFNLSEFLEELYSMMAAQTKAKKQVFDMHTKGMLPECVLGDKLRLNQILLNLLSNAVKYTPEKGEIDLLIESMAKHVHNHVHLRISVKDNGIGMSEEFVKVIFEPFSRETKASTKEIQGTGLGMAITKNIVDLMGGTISVTSTPNKGSTFVVEIELPIGGDAQQDDKDFWKTNNVTRVLVVDDEEDVCVDIQELMRDTGVNVEYALCGKKGIEMVCDANRKNEDYHIVLLDWKMPEMDGVETAKRIRKKVGNEIPIMVLTSYSFDEIEDQAKEAGIDYFLPKPFFVSNFRNAISQIRDTGKKEGAAPETIEEISLKGLKVLAAEDNGINAEILCELLDIEEVQCDIAEDGKQALDMFEKSEPGRYDMIFMDVQMPVMNGYEATRAIRACSHPDAKTIPIIAMTANAFDDDVKAALDAGMNAHLAKPIDMNKLKRIIADLREGNHAEQ